MLEPVTGISNIHSADTVLGAPGLFVKPLKTERWQDRRDPIVVVGGGLAGIAAATVLESCGLPVMLLEARQDLGGRAGSFQDAQSGEILDNCQHVLLGCCTNLIDLYRRLGALEHIRWYRRVHYLDPSGRHYSLWGVPGLPAPLHLGPSMGLFNLLSPAQRLSVAHAMRAMMRIGRSGRAALANVSFGEWLARHHQSPAVIQKFYDPVVISALNEDTQRTAAIYAVEVFQEAMLRNRRGYMLGLPDCPLQTLYSKRPCRDIRLGKRVAEITCRDRTVTTVRLVSGETIAASAVVLATNHHAASKMIAPEWLRTDSRFAGLEKLESVPILGAHLWFDRPLMKIPHAALIEGPLQWLFRKDSSGTAIHGVISAARQWVSTPHDRCAALFEHQLRTIFHQPEARLVRYRIVIEKRATFSPVPGVDRYRPTQEPPAGGIENLFLAGDYTQTGWPATMEGAVRSGYLAAGAVLKALPQTAGLPTPLADDLPFELSARLISGRD